MSRKKQIKDQVKENGFYINFVADHLSYTDAVKKVSSVKQDSVVFDSKEEIPEGDNIVVMSGILSQNYPVGKKSRNGYKIVQTGVDYSDYKHNNIVLLQHNDDFGGIGRARMIYLDNQGNSNIIMYVDLNTISDEAVRYQIKNGYMKGVSTGHNLIESMFEDAKDKGNLLSAQDAAEKYGYDEVWDAVFGMSDTLIYTVTKALMIENSVVTIGSNEKAILAHDTIGNYAIRDIMSKDFIRHSLFADKNGMTREEIKALIENSILNGKEQAEMLKLLDSVEDENLETVEQEVEQAIEQADAEDSTESEEAEVSEGETSEEVSEEVELTNSTENTEEEVSSNVDEEVELENENEEVVVDAPEAEVEAESEPGVKDNLEVEDVEGEQSEVEEAMENVEESVEEKVEDNLEEEEEGELVPALKISNSVERHTNEIDTLKNEFNELKTIVDSLVKKNDELTKANDELTVVNKELVDAISSIADMTLKNSRNLSNLVALGVSEVTKKEDPTSNSLAGLKNKLAKGFR